MVSQAVGSSFTLDLICCEGADWGAPDKSFPHEHSWIIGPTNCCIVEVSSRESDLFLLWIERCPEGFAEECSFSDIQPTAAEKLYIILCANTNSSQCDVDLICDSYY